MSIDIIFANHHFVFVDKPYGMLSVPSRMGSKDPRPVLGLLLQAQMEQQLYPVHRLDEDVAGLMIFAKTPEAHRAANIWFEHHQVSKTYEALSRPLTDLDSFKIGCTYSWECLLMRGKKRAYEAPFGKPSKTLAKVVAPEIEDHSTLISIWHLRPLTGRSHQLRYEMSRHGFPIAGDHLYQSPLPATASAGIELKSIQLDFIRCPDLDRWQLPPVMTIQSRCEIGHW